MFLVFGQTVFHQFVNYDDPQYILQNPPVNEGLTSRGVTWAVTAIHANNWHPLSWLSHMLDCQLYGLAPWGHHLTNVLLHAANAVLLFLLLWKMTGEVWPSALVAAVFAIHPLRVESVAWVSERKDLLSGFLFLLTIAAYVRYARRPFSVRRYLLVAAIFALALMAKPMVVTLPCVLLLLDYWPLRRFTADPTAQLATAALPSAASPGRLRIAGLLLLEKLPLLALSLAASMATLRAQEDTVAGVEVLAVFWRAANAIVAYAAYLGQIFVPTNLALFYPHWGSRLPLAYAVLALLVLAAITIGVGLLWRKRPYLLVGWLWYLGMLVPVIGLVQVGAQAMADRYTYLPQIGIYIGLAWTAASLPFARADNRWAWASVAALLLLVGMSAFTQTTRWSDSETLWRHSIACTRPNPIAFSNFALALADVGKFDEAREYCQKVYAFRDQCPLTCAITFNEVGEKLRDAGREAESLEPFTIAVQLQPDFAPALCNLGEALRRIGRIDEAIAHLQRSVRLRDRPAAHTNLGAALAQRGDISGAMQHFARALQLDANCYEAYNNRGAALAGQGKLDEAIQDYRQALAIAPNYAQAHNNLGFALAAQGKLFEATEHYRKALLAMPDYARARVNLAQVLMQRGLYSEAVVEWERMATAYPGDPSLLSSLASAYAGAGQGAKAIAVARQALQLARQQHNEALVQSLEAALKQYELRGKPLR